MMNNEMTNSERDLAFANWLCRNTDFTINEISRLCPAIHEFKLVLLKRGNVNLELPEINPVKEGIIKPEVLHSFRLLKNTPEIEDNSSVKKEKVKVYIPKVLRKYIGGVISWFLENHPQLNEKQLITALGLDRKKFLKLKELGEEQINPVSIQMFSEYNLEQILGLK